MIILKREQPSEVGSHSREPSLRVVARVQELSKKLDEIQNTHDPCIDQRRNEQRHFLIFEMSRVNLINTYQNTMFFGQ